MTIRPISRTMDLDGNIVSREHIYDFQDQPMDERITVAVQATGEVHRFKYSVNDHDCRRYQIVQAILDLCKRPFEKFEEVYPLYEALFKG